MHRFAIYRFTIYIYGIWQISLSVHCSFSPVGNCSCLVGIGTKQKKWWVVGLHKLRFANHHRLSHFPNWFTVCVIRQGLQKPFKEQLVKAFKWFLKALPPSELTSTLCLLSSTPSNWTEQTEWPQNLSGLFVNQAISWPLDCEATNWPCLFEFFGL